MAPVVRARAMTRPSNGEPVSSAAAAKASEGALAVFGYHDATGNLALRVESANAYLANTHPGCAHDCIFLVCDECGEATHVDDEDVSRAVRAIAAVHHRADTLGANAPPAHQSDGGKVLPELLLAVLVRTRRLPP